MTSAVRRFLTNNDLSDKFLAVFSTARLTGIENALKQVSESISSKDFEFIPTLPLIKRDLMDEVLQKKIDEFHIAATTGYKKQ